MEDWTQDGEAALEWHNSQTRPVDDVVFQSHVTSLLGYECLLPSSDKFSPFYAGSLEDFRMLAAPFSHFEDSSGRKLIVRAGFTTNTVPNAFASRDADAHYVGMSESLFTAILDIAAYVFSQRHLFTDIGDPSVELSPRYGWQEIAGFYPARAHMAGHHIHPWYYEARLPRNPTRRSGAMALTITMARYVWLHEYMHCALGHIGFIAAMSDKSAFNEFSPQLELIGLSKRGGEAERARAILHAMELEADWRAFRTMLIAADKGGPNVGLAKWDPGHRLLFAVFGTYLVTWLFDQQQAHNVGQLLASHPTPARRAASLVERATQSFPELGDLADLLPQWLSKVVDSIPENPPYPITPAAPTIEQEQLDEMLAKHRFIEP